MCGKITQAVNWAEATTYEELVAALTDDRVDIGTPMRLLRVIARDDAGTRRSVTMRWGLIPPWETDPTRISGTIHARAETIDQKPSFKAAFAQRRGILPVRTFNEGRELPNGKTEQHVITPKDGQPLGIAVIWERWTSPQGSSLLTFAMVTVPPNKLIGTITDRMPAVLPPGRWAQWLGEEPASPEELKTLLKPQEGDWDMAPQSPPPRPSRSPRPAEPDPQPDLF
jgi:putative SOS response-associated peptidase YedK